MATPSRPRRGTKSAPRRRLKTSNSSRSPNPIDIHVGARVRLRRNLLGLTLETLAKAVGVTYQQLQKYERGVNRISASRLFNLRRALDVPVSFFFEDMLSDAASARRVKVFSERIAGELDHDLLSKRETVELIRRYCGVTDLRMRKRLLGLMKDLGVTR